MENLIIPGFHDRARRRPRQTRRNLLHHSLAIASTIKLSQREGTFVFAMLGELLATRYRIIAVLGSGGFGHTYIAEDTQRPGNPRCVLKHLTFDSSNPAVLQQVRRLFQAEAETLEKLGKHDQIPRLLAYFDQDQQFYLVQEFIDGHPLSQELARGEKLTEPQAIAVLQDVLSILEFVHAQGVIHRDIKPENLVRRRSDGRFVLIDFGAVKNIVTVVAESTGETQLSMPIYTSGYAASEQCIGRPQFNSDLYSLGMVGIQMLTGMRPSQLPHDFHTSEVIWRDQATVGEALADFLTHMTRYHHRERFASATEAWQALQTILAGSPTVLTGTAGLSTQLADFQHSAPGAADSQPTDFHRSRTHLSAQQQLVAVAGLAIAATMAVFLLVRNGAQPPPLPMVTVSPSAPVTPPEIRDRISSGEKLLNQWQSTPQKQECVERLAAKDFDAAIAALQVARQKEPGDPELLIYLNNARMRDNPAYKIAVVAPLGDTFGSALEILRGVAQAQDEVNRSGGIQGKPLKVVIASDDNRPDLAAQLAKALTTDEELLGVVGHGISDTTLAAAGIYQQQGMVMVSPLSSVVQLSNVGSYIFRTMPSDRLTARALANALLNRLKRRKVVVFFNSASAYSTSLKHEFRDALFYNQVEVLREFDLDRPDFDAAESLEQAIAQGAQAILLAADSQTSDKALLVVKLNDRRLPLLAGDSLATPKTLKVAGKDATGMVLAIPTNLTQSPFLQQATALWGKSAEISWRTALAYDASKSLIVAIQQDPSRKGMQRAMAQPGFSAIGAAGKVSFLPSGDRQGQVHLMTIVPLKAGKTVTYVFRPLP